MPVCQSLSGKMLLRHHCISIITNQCTVIIGKCPLRYSMETNLSFPTLEYLGLMLMSLSHKSNDMTNCLLRLLWFFFSFIISFLFCSTLLTATREVTVLLTIVISLSPVQLPFSSHTYSLIYLLSFIRLTSLLPILLYWSAVTIFLIMVCLLHFHHILSHSTSYSICLSSLGPCALVLHI